MPATSATANLTHYPTELFTYEEISSGAWILYIIGLIYMFIGIMQVHRLYLEPCLYLFRKGKTFSEDTMESTVDPIATTAPEYYMCLFSTFFGVTDVGISTFLGTNAFTACIERGVFILLAGAFGEVDWYTSFRDMITYSITLFATAMLLLDGSIATWNSIIMILIFFIYWLFMKFNKYIERSLRESVRLKSKFKIGPRLEDDEIKALHCIKHKEKIYSPRSMMEETYELSNSYMTFTYKNIKKRVKVKLVEGSYKEKFPKLFDCTNKIICSLLCKKLREKIDRSIYAKIQMEKMAKLDSEMANNNANDEENKKSSFSQAVANDDRPITPNEPPNTFLAENPAGSNLIMPRKQNSALPDRLPSVGEGMVEPNVKEKIDLANLKKTPIDDSDNDLFSDENNLQKESIVWPKEKSIIWKIIHVLLVPMNLILYVTIPNPRIALEKQVNLLPLAFMMCLVWMGVLSFFITWWMVTLSVAWGLPYLILPMLIFPIGLLLRDFPKWIEFREKILKMARKEKQEEIEREKQDFAEEMKEAKEMNLKDIGPSSTIGAEKAERKKERIPEYYSGQIFIFTMGTSITWLIYTLIEGDIVLLSNCIWLQILLLMAVILTKLAMFFKASFKTPFWLFVAHLVVYAIYMVCVMIFEFVY